MWHPNLHVNTPLYWQLHIVLCNLQFKHHANVTTVNILVIGAPTVLPNTAAHNSVCYMKSSGSEFPLAEKVNSLNRTK